MSLWAAGSSVNRSLLVAATIAVVGLIALTAGVLPAVGCETTYGLELTERGDVSPGDDGVVAVDELPSDVASTTRDAATTATADAAGGASGGATVTITEPTYKIHLEDRFVAVDGVAYEPALVEIEDCGGVLEDALVVLGAFLAAIGVLGVGFVALYGRGRPPINRLHLVAAALLVVGATVFATGVALPAGCTDNYALETRELPGANETNQNVVDAQTLPASLQATVERSVTSNQTAFLDRDQYREYLEANAVRFDGTLHETDAVLVQDCGGGLDDAFLLLGLLVATLGAVALSLLVLYDHGEKVL